MNIDFKYNRPKGFPNKEAKFLIPLINEIEKLIANTQNLYLYDSIKLNKKQRQVLSTLIIEFAEDLHNDIGLWNSVEYYNKQLFNTPLPLFVNSENEIHQVFDVNRIKYFIYTILYEFEQDLIISAKHKDLDLLTNTISTFLSDKFQNVPHISSIKDFLSQPNDLGWDVKQKLVWVGTNSYLFKLSFFRYVIENNKGIIDIPVVDDYICQENTIWSGLGVIDILAKTLDLSATNANDVKSWYERYVSYYRVLSSAENKLTLENVINKTQYAVRSTIDQNKAFNVNDIIIGGIVPYGDYWYWSGVQRNGGPLEKNVIDELKNDFIRKSSRIVYRYDKQLLAKAKESLEKHYKEFIAFFGSDLVIFKDGLSMAAALQKKDREKYESLPKNQLAAHLKKYDLKNPFPVMDLPDDVINSENGIGVFFNSAEGIEIMLGFDDLVSGFKKEGKDLTEEECDSIKRFITSDAISPNYVYKMIERYQAKSINVSFLLNTEMNTIDYLLHKYKGHYFRNRYPEITLLDE
jgi:hypothetical protein